MVVEWADFTKTETTMVNRDMHFFDLSLNNFTTNDTFLQRIFCGIFFRLQFIYPNEVSHCFIPRLLQRKPGNGSVKN